MPRRTKQGIAAVLVGACVGVAAVAAELLLQGVPLEMAEKLADAKEIYVATQRKDGTRSRAVPVWFGVMDGSLWFTTSPDTYKGKRIRRGSPVFVSVSGKDGPFVAMKAEIVQDGEAAEKLGKLYEKKYWIAWLGFFRPRKERVLSGQTLLIRLTPVEGSSGAEKAGKPLEPPTSEGR